MTGHRCIRAFAVLLILCLSLWGCSREEPSPPKAETKTETKAEIKPPPSPKVAGSPVASDGVDSGKRPQSSPESPPAQKGPVQIEAVSFDPVSPVTGDSLKAVVTASSGAMEDRGLSYRWKINGQVVQESQSAVLDHVVKRKEFVEVEVREGSDNSADKFVSGHVMISNGLPVLKVVSQDVGSDGKYQARLEASDPDRDPISFSLKSGPPGMSVDPGTGAIHWTMAADAQGAFPVEVSAMDSEGAETILSYQITIRRESAGGT